MKEMEKSRKILCIGTFVIMFVIMMSLLWTPQVSSSADIDTFEVTNVLGYDDVSSTNNCQIDEDGCVEILGGDSFLMFSDLSNHGRIIKVNFKEPLEEDTLIELYINKKWGFSEVQKMQYEYTKGETSIYFLLGDYSYVGLRLDINIPFQLESIETGNAEITVTNQTDNPLWFLWSMGIALIAAVGAFWVDEKYGVADYFAKKLYAFKVWVKKNFKYVIILGILSCIVSVLLTGLPYVSLFDAYEFLIMTTFVFVVLCALICLWSYRKSLIENFEKVFVLLLLLVGVSMVLVAPMAHLSWDTDAHYRLALEASYLGDTKLTRTDEVIVKTEPISFITLDPMTNFSKLGMLTLGYEEVVDSYEGSISIAHLPSGIFIALGRLFRLPFFLIYMMGKFANILLYTIVCYFSLKKLKNGKLVLAIIALFPTNVFLACNYSYDYWVTVFSLLGMSYFIGELQERDKTISTKDTIIMCGALALACLPKKIYFPLLLIPFLMPKHKIENRKKYYTICILVLIALVLLFMQAAGIQTSGTGDLRGGSTVGPADQIAFIFSDIFGYVLILLRFLFEQYLSVANIPNYVSLCAYLDVVTGTSLIMLLLMTAVLFDRDAAYTKESKSNWLSRIYVILMFFGGCALVATSMYVAFTPVGSQTILGCQARYLIPWLYPLLSVLSMNRIKPIIPKKWMYWAVTVGCFGNLFYNLATVFLPSVIAI